MISAMPRLLLDALDGQREDRLHRGSTAINVQQLAGDEARLVSAEENHGVADVGWQAEAPHGRPAPLSCQSLIIWNTWGGSPLTLSSQAPRVGVEKPPPLKKLHQPRGRKCP
jgi:hypothetical protein